MKKGVALAILVTIVISIISVMTVVSTNTPIGISNKCVCSGNVIHLEPHIESPHNYPSNYNHTWNISQPNACKIRLHFSKLETESVHDRIDIYDYNDTLIKSYSGAYDEMWTPWVDGDTIKVRLKTDQSQTKFGFVIDRKGYVSSRILSISTDKKIYNLSEIVNLTLEINRSANFPVISIFKLEFCDIGNKSEIVNESTPFTVPAEIKAKTTTHVKIPDNMWISSGLYVFKLSLIEPTTNAVVDCDSTVIYIDDKTTHKINVSLPLP